MCSAVNSTASRAKLTVHLSLQHLRVHQALPLANTHSYRQYLYIGSVLPTYSFFLQNGPSDVSRSAWRLAILKDCRFYRFAVQTQPHLFFWSEAPYPQTPHSCHNCHCTPTNTYSAFTRLFITGSQIDISDENRPVPSYRRLASLVASFQLSARSVKAAARKHHNTSRTEQSTANELQTRATANAIKPLTSEKSAAAYQLAPSSLSAIPFGSGEVGDNAGWEVKS